MDLYLHNNANKAYTFLAEEKSLLPSLINLLDHSSVVIRGKTLLAFYLMFETNLKWMLVLAENKFAPLLDKLKDSHKYVDCCLVHLVDLIVTLVPRILKNIAEGLKKLKQMDDSDPEALPPKEQINYLELLPMILGVMSSSILRNKIVNSNFLMTMFNIYDYSENLKDSINVGRIVFGTVNSNS